MSKNLEIEVNPFKNVNNALRDITVRPTTMGGCIAQRGFIFQTIIALIECLERNDWDQVKIEPQTVNDKVDIHLYLDNYILKAIQVKSSQRAFERSDVSKWLEAVKKDSPTAKEVFLYLVGDLYTPTCEAYIKATPEVRTFPFATLVENCKTKLQEYVAAEGRGNLIDDDDLQSAYNNLISEIQYNSISKAPFSRDDFEKWLQRVLLFPKCLTTIPSINREVGLIGREQELYELRELLDNDGCIALISGLGGIGKTAIMRWICNGIKDDGIANNHVAWISCGASLKEDLLLLRVPLGITSTDNSEEDYNLVINKLRNFKGTLYLFLDSLSRSLDNSEINILNSLQPAVHVMITARHKVDGFPCRDLKALDLDSACQMFYGYYGRDASHAYMEFALNIVKTVRCHTLLVELLARAAAKSGGTLEDFNSDLQEKGFFDIFKRPIKTINNDTRTIEESVIKLYEITVLPGNQQRILKLFTIFTPEKEIYYKVSDWAELDMDAMDDLVDRAWLERGGLENGYFIHQIVKDSISRQVGTDLKLEDYGSLLERVTDTESYMPQNLIYTKTKARLILAEDVLRYLEWKSGNILPGEDLTLRMTRVEIAATLLQHIGNIYRNLGEYENALNVYELSLAIKEKIYPENHLAISMTCNEIGVLYSSMGNYGGALEYFERARKVDEILIGPEAPNVAVILNNIAGVYQDRGDYKEALGYYRKALDIQENNPDVNPVDLASTYNNVGGALYEYGDIKEALNYLKKALLLRETHLGHVHPSTAITCGNLASVFRSRGNYNKALEYNEKALEIFEQILSPRHPLIARIYAGMGDIYAGLDKYNLALDYYKKAIEISEVVLNKQHPYLAVVYSNAAIIYSHLGDDETAILNYENALSINKANFGDEHPNLAATYSSMSTSYSRQGKYEEALKCLNRALKIVVKFFGTDHPNRAFIYGDMGTVYYEMGDYGKAIENYKAALDIIKKSPEEGELISARLYYEIADVYKDLKKYDLALECFQKSLRIFERLRMENHSIVATIYERISGIEFLQGDFIKALENCQKALSMRQAQLGSNHPLIRSTQTYECVLKMIINRGMNGII